jgi:hypothetical protein
MGRRLVGSTAEGRECWRRRTATSNVDGGPMRRRNGKGAVGGVVCSCRASVRAPLWGEAARPICLDRQDVVRKPVWRAGLGSR